jgi:hypothetical protein
VIESMREHSDFTNPDAFIFSRSGGDIPMKLEVLSKAVHDIAGKKRGYRQGDLRRTAETRLAGLKVSQADRAELLSHGRASGVQKKHYDRNLYLAEKQAALAVWHAHLDGLTATPAPAMPSNVRPLRKAS